jgi:putative intracellular protease/amidase
VALLDDTPQLPGLDLDAFDALMIAGGQSPMFTCRPDCSSRSRSATAGW